MRRLRALFNLTKTPQIPSYSTNSTLLLHDLASPHLKRRSANSYFSRVFSSVPAAAESYEFGFTGHREKYRSVDEEEEVVRYVPVKAYFLSTSIDLKSLQAENVSDVIPPSSRSLNYIALRFSDLPHEIMEIGMKESRDNRYSYRYLVVFQYGSAVLFNIADHEAEQYLDIVRKHASGLLSEMRKDEQETAEEEIDPIAMLAAVLAARAGRSRRFQRSLDSILFPAPRRRVFKPSLDTIIEDPEAEEEAERADQLDILKVALDMRAQAKRAEAAKAELEAEAVRAEVEEKEIAPDMEADPKKRRKNWIKRLIKKCKRGRREERETK